MYEHVYLYVVRTATTEIYALSLHDALPISVIFKCKAFAEIQFPLRAFICRVPVKHAFADINSFSRQRNIIADRKSTRLNSSHSQISYAVFCLKNKIKSQKHLVINHHLETDE